MAVYRMQVSYAADTMLARDRFVITPHFRTQGGPLTANDVEALTTDLADALGTMAGAPHETRVTAYNAEGPPPHDPLAEEVRNANGAGGSPVPRELALCLSFFSGQNKPSLRGRLYIPAPMFATSAQARPSADHRQRVADYVPIFTELGGIDIDWCVWSRKNQSAHPVTDWWVDDEWDTVRSRGMRPTMRLAGTTSEG